ncbi:MAG: hypothetical protein DCC58_06975 [Chloroflexi bacterium]|nr:MAG: hypothetical protein DCC58_06975 [Chloroflexota bacterium]
MSRATLPTTGNVKPLTRRDFFSAVSAVVQANLPPDPRTLQTRQTMNLLKLHYGANYRVHYEAWIAAERGLLELGLHFEDGPASTERLLAFFDRYILEIKHELGVEAELERWTQSWGHLHEVRPLEPLTLEFAASVGMRLTRYITLLQPLLDEAYDTGLVPKDPRPSTFHERFRNRRG